LTETIKGFAGVTGRLTFINGDRIKPNQSDY